VGLLVLKDVMIQTPLGAASLQANGASIYHLQIDDASSARKSTAHAMAQQELDAYFAGTLRQFKTPLILKGTPFQQAVWAAVQQIPYGQTRSYADIARAIGRPKAVRAVGTAIGANPVWIMVPCHRVIQSNGGLGGYAGGIERKRWLLEHEMRVGINQKR
jgi:methylated-DNA-[protein]-cysteine S-methyltransferase